MGEHASTKDLAEPELGEPALETPPDGEQDADVAPVAKQAEVLRNFRQQLANKHQHGGGKRQKPAGGNPRFR